MHKRLKRAKGEIALGIGAIVISILFILESNRIQDIVNVMVSAKFFPRIFAGLMLICAFVIFVNGVRSYLTVPQEIKQQDKMTKEQKQGLLRVFEVFAALLVTAIFFKSLGFLVVAPVAMFLLFVILEEPEKRNYKLFILLSIISPIIVYFMFYYLFSNILPMGILRPVLYMII